MASAQSTEDTGYTLHVFTDRMQFASLILDENAHPVANLTRQDILLTLDSGPLFHPNDLRLEGDDPLTMAVLIEDAGSQTEYLEAFLQDFAQQAPQLFLPQDSLRLYAVHCSLSVAISPASSPTTQRIADTVRNLRQMAEHPSTGSTRSCKRTLPLLDSIASAAQWLQQQNGRRVLLVVSQGNDKTSKLPLEKLRTFLDFAGITLVGLRDWDRYRMNLIGLNPMAVNPFAPHALASDNDGDDLFQLAAGSGGFIMSGGAKSLPDDLNEIFHLLRARYIVSFSRPRNGLAGNHLINIQSGNPNAVTLRIAGATVPLISDEQINTPNAVPTQDSPAVFGKHHHH